ncbi:MAG TPA: type II toxin-antitoxin system Phd/YefM family antitoxin [Mycobacteriales bacterium]|nr:type II toxin-antitoxin system Phd/YefM family antitoxin [Mycobacteriales bacterium]
MQEAKQRFSEVVRSAETDGPQFVTRHGDEVAVVLDIREYRRLKAGAPDLKAFLRSEPLVDPPDIDRSQDLARPVSLD